MKFIKIQENNIDEETGEIEFNEDDDSTYLINIDRVIAVNYNLEEGQIYDIEVSVDTGGDFQEIETYIKGKGNFKKFMKQFTDNSSSLLDIE